MAEKGSKAVPNSPRELGEGRRGQDGGLQALPIPGPRRQNAPTNHLPNGFRRGVQHPDAREPVPDGFRQGTEPSRKFLVDLNTGLVKEHISEMDRRVVSDVPAQRKGAGWVRMENPSTVHLLVPFRGEKEPRRSIPASFRQGTEPKMSIPASFRQGTEPKMSIPVAFRQGTEPKMSIPASFRQGTEPKTSIPASFRQGTEPKMSIPAAFRQGTEPKMSIPASFRQGTEPKMSIPVAFRQGTEPKMSIPVAFRQGTEPKMSIPVSYRQGTEPKMSIPVSFRQGTEPKNSIPSAFRQGTEPSRATVKSSKVACKGEIIYGKCYEFNPKLLAFKDAQAFCRNLAPDAELASVTSRDLHFQLVSLVTRGGKTSPRLTWLGATVKNQQASWVDGSDWSYSDWMPGHPNIHTDKPVCVEMFKMDESWWTAADCELKRASLCSYPVTA
uniref:C-type lectin domain-containing protein n=1 Tax=Cyprinodon variegatus TaxID=28743 RepID=A0A3Q2CLJ3_CYPVA